MKRKQLVPVKPRELFQNALALFIDDITGIYVPNIFSPNGDNINDKLLISAGPQVKEISSLTIFNRWGNMVYNANHFPAGDLNYAWDGTLKGRVLNSAVFTYKMIADFKDGRQEVRVGDVTLVR